MGKSARPRGACSSAVSTSRSTTIPFRPQSSKRSIGTGQSRAKLPQPIAAYEEVKGDENRIIPWSANSVFLYQTNFFEGDLALNRARQDIPASVMASIVDPVRTRVLTLVLELKDQTVEKDVDVEALATYTVQTLVQLTIIGGNNVFGKAS